MCSDTDQYDRVCRGQFELIHEKLDKLDEAIRGNGKPGIQQRLGRIEASEAVRSRLLWLVGGAVTTLAVAAVWRLVIGG